MLILISDLVGAILIGVSYYLATGDILEAVVIGALIFIALESFLRSILNKKFPLKLWKTKSVEQLEREKA